MVRWQVLKLTSAFCIGCWRKKKIMTWKSILKKFSWVEMKETLGELFFFFNSSGAVVGHNWFWSSSLMLCNCFVWWDLVWLQYIRSFMLMRLLKLYPPPYRGMGFPDGASGEKPICQCRRRRDASSIPGSGRSPGGGHGNLLQYCCLESHGQRNLAGYVGSIGSQRVGHDWSNLACMHLCTHVEE